MARDDLLIIGAGPAGLSLSMAYDGSSRILERAGEVGGLCRSVSFGGAVFDLGGHSFHSPHPEVMDLVEDLMAGHWSGQRRDARVHFQGELIDYPFQNSIDQIADPIVAADCRRGAPTSTAAADAATNLEDWIQGRFGEGVARHFMLPYNRKLWARDLRRVSCEWVSERIAGAEVQAVKTPNGAVVPKRQPLRSTSEIGYPAEGGFGGIFKTMTSRCGPISFDQDVTSIDLNARSVRTAGGATWNWGRLVSTMPLPLLLSAIDGCPASLLAAADRLETVSMKIVMLCVAGPVADAPQRVYVASPDMPAHKIAFNHTSSPNLRSRPVHAIMAEVAYSPDKPAPADDELIATSVDWLADAGLISSTAAVVEARVVDLVHGYPVYTHERPAIVAAARAWLEPRGVHTIGRFGAWAYVNSDACIHEGLKLAARLKAPWGAEV